MPTTHNLTHAMTPEVHWFGWFFCTTLMARIFGVTRTTLPVIVSMTYALLSWENPYFFLNFVTNLFSLYFPQKYYDGSGPFMGNLVICDINSTVTGTDHSNHRYPPWKNTNNFLAHALASTNLPKWGIWMRPKSPNFYNTNTHYYGMCTIGSLSFPVLS